jgi:hypothetical protein
MDALKQHPVVLLFHCYLEQFQHEGQDSEMEDKRPDEYEMHEQSIAIVTRILRSVITLTNLKESSYYQALANSLVFACGIPTSKICMNAESVQRFFTKELTKDAQFEYIANMYLEIKQAALMLLHVTTSGTEDALWK